MLQYFPYQSQLLNTLDFVSLTQNIQEIKNQVLLFNEKFSIVPLNQISNLSKELNQLMNHPNFIWLKSTAKDSSLYLWDLIQNTFGESSFTFLPRLFEVAHSLPASSAGIEQSFSLVKLVRNSLRSNLREDTTQSLLLIAQEFHDDYQVSDEMVSSYNDWKTENERIKVELNGQRPNSEQEHANDEEVTHENRGKDETEKIKQVKVIKVGGVKEQIPSSKIEIEETKALEKQDLPREEGRGKRKNNEENNNTLKRFKTKGYLGLTFRKDENSDSEEFKEHEEEEMTKTFMRMTKEILSVKMKYIEFYFLVKVYL